VLQEHFPRLQPPKSEESIEVEIQSNRKSWSLDVVVRPKKHLNFIESTTIWWIPVSTCWEAMNAVLLFCNLTSSSKRNSIQSWMQADRLGKHGNGSVMGWSWLPLHGFYWAKLHIYYSDCNGLRYIIVFSGRLGNRVNNNCIHTMVSWEMSDRVQEKDFSVRLTMSHWFDYYQYRRITSILGLYL